MISQARKMLNYTYLGLAALAIVIMATGCWDRREINELAFQSSVALDLEGGQRVLTSEIVRPAAAGGGERGGGTPLPQRQVVLVSGRGETLLAAGRHTSLGLPRRAYLAHTTAVLVGEEMARHGLQEVLDFVDRHPELRRTTYILITRGPAREVLIRAQGGLETSLGKEISGLRKWVQVSGYGVIPNINDVFFDLSNGAATTVLPVLELSPEPFPPMIGAGTAGGGGASQGGSASGQRVVEPETVRTVRVGGTGLFYHDKLVGWMDRHQTRGWAWVRNKVQGGILELPCGEGDSRVSVDVTEARAQVNVDTKSGQLQGKIKLKVQGKLLEQQCSRDLSKEEAIRELQDRMTALITAEITDALNQAKMAGTDVFGFGGALYRQQPKIWRQLHERWNEEFKKIPVELEIQARLEHIGNISRPWQPRAR